ncbi:MAG: hypothetical protein NVSMB55_21840 [Mycobacteriales bacterium]
MSAATIETPKSAKNSASAESARLSVPSSAESTEEAITQLVHGSVSTLRSLLPSAAVRPTQTGKLVFDVAEQFLVAVRRLTLEIAAAIEAGAEGVERYETTSAGR